jgi:hypothetical protein
VRILAATALAACTPVYDSQYDDRKAELEEARTEFLPADINVKLITGAQDKLYWVDVTKPLDLPVLHSFKPSTGERMDYGAWSNAEFGGQPADIFEEFLFGSSLIVDCAFGIRVFDATTPDTGELPMRPSEGFKCAVDGENVYYIVGRDVFKWRARTEAPPTVPLLNLDSAGVGTGSIGSLSVIGDLALLSEGGDLWTIDLVTKQGTYLNNPIFTGAGFFDTKGALYDSQDGLQFTTFATGQTFSFESAVADGGYRLNGHYSDIEEVGDFSEFVISGSHVIYRSRGGIFAYGLETKKTIDILLDGRFDESTFDKNPSYRQPVVTIDNTLFVINDDGFGGGDGEVYRVDMADRLR